MGQLDAVEQAAHFLSGQDDRQFEVRIGPEDLEGLRPLSLQRFFPEEFDGAEGLRDGGAGQFLVFLEMDEVETQLVRGDRREKGSGLNIDIVLGFSPLPFATAAVGITNLTHGSKSPSAMPLLSLVRQPLHARHEVPLGGFHHQMKMIRHQAKCLHQPICLRTRLAQGGEKALPIYDPLLIYSGECR